MVAESELEKKIKEKAEISAVGCGEAYVAKVQYESTKFVAEGDSEADAIQKLINKCFRWEQQEKKKNATDEIYEKNKQCSQSNEKTIF
jgi:hypothetical protein